jgi:hypothetical protein
MNKLVIKVHKFSSVGSNLTKSAGLPNFGTKRENLGAIVQYLETVVKPNFSAAQPTKDIYCHFIGSRTQQSSPEEPKVRDINEGSGSAWGIESEAYNGKAMIDAMQKHWVYSDTNRSEVAFTPPERWWQLVADKSPEVVSWVVLDAKDFNKHVWPGELTAFVEATIPDYEFKAIIENLYRKVEILTWKGYVQKDGGNPSGVRNTNPINSVCNVDDIVRAFGRLAIFIVVIIVNGDDILIGFKTLITKNNIGAMARYSRRIFNKDKSDILSSGAEFSKRILDPRLPGPTSAIARVANSHIHSERQSDAITSSKQYTAIAAASIIDPLKYHPLGDEYRKLYYSIDKYSVTDFGSAELLPYARAYLSRNSWKSEHGQITGDPKQFISTLKSSWAAQS